jgi:hypothetical protein
MCLCVCVFDWACFHMVLVIVLISALAGFSSTIAPSPLAPIWHIICDFVRIQYLMVCYHMPRMVNIVDFLAICFYSILFAIIWLLFLVLIMSVAEIGS